MEVQLEDLLETIKRDGVESAEKEAGEIIARAKAEAEAIIASAEKKAMSLRETAQQDANRFENSAKAAVSQASRDLLISIQKSVEDAFNDIIQKTVAEHFSGDALTECIVNAVKSFKVDGELELASADLKTIEKNLRARLGKEIKEGLEIKVNTLLSGGFILKEKGGKAYYDFSDESIAEAMRAAVSQQIADLISI